MAPKLRMPMPDGNDFSGIPLKYRQRFADESAEEVWTQANWRSHIRTQLLDMACRTLSHRQMQVFILHDIAGISYLGTAEALAISVAACRTARASAIKRLSQCTFDA